MSQVKSGLVLAMALGGWGAIGYAQPIASTPAQNAVLSTRFLTPLAYEAALARLGSYYEEQVGRKLEVAFPEIAPRSHFEVWHDMWVFFDVVNGQTAVTLKRPTAGISGLLIKSWMLGFWNSASAISAEFFIDCAATPALLDADNGSSSPTLTCPLPATKSCCGGPAGICA